MSTQQLYQKVINEQMSKTEFLWNVRRDDRLTSIVSNIMSFEDTISVLKGKGHVWDASQEAPATRPFDFIGTMKSLNEASKKENKLKGGKGDKLDADHVNYHEFTKGWKHELEHTDDIDKAKEIALDHLAEDPNYYTRLDMVEYQDEKSKKKTTAKKTKEGSMVDTENQMTPVDKKKVKSNVKAGLGKQEKAKSKNAGAKVMKGGSGEMTSVKESFVGLLPAKKAQKDSGDDESNFEKALLNKDIPELASIVVDDIKYNNERYFKEYLKDIVDRLDDESIQELNDQIDTLLDRIGGYEGHEDDYHVEPKGFKKSAKSDTGDLTEGAATDLEFKTNVEYIWKIVGRNVQSGKLDQFEYEYLLSKGDYLEFFDYKERAKDVKAKEVPQSVDITKDPTKFVTKKDNPTKKIDTYSKYSSTKGVIEKDIDDTLKYEPDQIYMYRREEDRRGNAGTLSQEEFDSIKNDPKLLIFKKTSQEELDAIDARNKPKMVVTKDEPSTGTDRKRATLTNDPKTYTAPPMEKPDGDLYNYQIIPIKGGKSSEVQMTKKQAEKLANNDNFKKVYKIELKSEEPVGRGKNTKVVTTYAPGVKPAGQKTKKEKDRPTADIKGISSQEPETDGGGSYVGVKRKSEPNLGVKRIKPTPSLSSASKNWQVVDVSEPKQPIVIGAFDDKEEAIKMKGTNNRILVLPALALKRLNLEPLEEVLDDTTKKDLESANVSFIIPGEGDTDQKLDVSDTVKTAVFNNKDNSLTINLAGGNRVVFTPDAAGKPVGVYFSKQDGQEVSKQVLHVQPPLTTAINKVYASKKKEEPAVNETLENYIRERIRQAIKEGEEGQYIGMVGPEVLKKKLKEYMARYEWGHQHSGNPAVKARGQEIHGIVSKMVFELADDGVAIFNEYAPEEYQIENKEDLGNDPAFKVGLGPQDRDFNPEELTGRGGRVAEATYDEEDVKRYTDRMDKNIDDPSLEKDMADFGEKAMTNAFGNTAAQSLVARILGEYISKKGAQNIKNSNIIRGFHKLADKNK